MKKIKVTIIIPVYNEKVSVSKTIFGIRKALENYNFGYEIICVNDASKDGSEKILDQFAEKNIIKVINHHVNKGYGASIKTGIAAAEGDWIMITDADGTYPVDKMPLLLSQKDKYDMVVGARIGKKVKIPLLRRPIKFMLNKFSSYLSGQKIPDLNSGLRIFDKKIALKYWNLFPERFSFTSTMT